MAKWKVDFATGTVLRDEGMERAEAAEGDAYKALFINEARRQIAAGQRVTAETVTQVVGMPSRPNVVGAIFSGLKRAGEIREVGYVQAHRPPRHASRMLVWEKA